MNIAELVSRMPCQPEALSSVEALEKYIVEHFKDGEIKLSVEDVEEIEKMAEPYIVKI